MTILNYLKKTGHPLFIFGESYSGILKRWLYHKLRSNQSFSNPGVSGTHFSNLSEKSHKVGFQSMFIPFLKKEARKKKYQVGSFFFRQLLSINSLQSPLYNMNRSPTFLPFGYLKYPIGMSTSNKIFKIKSFFRKIGNFSTVSFLCAENYLAIGTVTGFLEIYNIDKKKLVYLMKGHNTEVSSVASHPNLFSIFSSSGNNISRLWKINNLMGNIETFSLFHKSEIEISKFREEGRLLDFVTSNKIWKSFDLVKQKWVFKRKFLGKISSIAFRRNDHLGAIGTKFSVIIFDLRIEKSVFALKTKQQRILSLEWTPDSLYLINSGRNRKGGLWDLRRWDSELSCFEHGKPIVSVKSHPCSEIIFSSSEDKTTKIWDKKKFKKIYTCKDHERAIKTSEFSKNASFFVSLSNKEVIVHLMRTSLV